MRLHATYGTLWAEAFGECYELVAGERQEILSFVDADDLNTNGSLEAALAVLGLGGVADQVVAGIRRVFAASGVRHCRECFCTEDRACLGADDEPCHWTEPNLCSSCAEAGTSAAPVATKKRARR